MPNKAHTAALRRIATRYEASFGNGSPSSPLLLFAGGTIAVETSATLRAGIERLQEVAGQRYVAVTNKETLAEAKVLVAGTGIGVMDARGEIVIAAQ